MAARFGCTIVPVSTVGEDDLIDVSIIPSLLQNFLCDSAFLCMMKKTASEDYLTVNEDREPLQPSLSGSSYYILERIVVAVKLEDNIDACHCFQLF